MNFHPDSSTTPPPFVLEQVGTLAKEEKDFCLESTVVSLQAGQNETEIILLILDDSEPEGQEVFFIYLTDAQGGAQITDSPYQGFGAFVKITILGKSLFCLKVWLKSDISSIYLFLLFIRYFTLFLFIKYLFQMVHYICLLSCSCSWQNPQFVFVTQTN